MSRCTGPGWGLDGQCNRATLAIDMCGTHYAQMARHGELTKIHTDEPIEHRFWRQISKCNMGYKSMCWVWTGAGSGKASSYGQLRHHGSSWMVHRWAWVYIGKQFLSSYETLDHLCRVTMCANPEHLEVVSRAENIERKHLYDGLRGEIQRLRLFVQSKGYDPITLTKVGD